jgi:predicted membrane GTPase involved in stress response
MNESLHATSSLPLSGEGLTHPEFPLERTCFHRYEPFQLTFARHALQLLPDDDRAFFEASHRGLVLRAETEAALERPIEILKDYFGNQISIGRPTVRHHHGRTVEEPHMVVRVKCRPEHFDFIIADLATRNAVVLETEAQPAFRVIRATAPLARLLGYAQSLADLTGKSAHQVMWLSHYAPVQASAPRGGGGDH